MNERRARKQCTCRKGGDWQELRHLPARMRTNIHDPLKNGKRASDYHRLSTAEAQPEADVFCGCQVQV